MLNAILLLVSISYAILNIWIFFERRKYRHIPSIPCPTSPLWFLGAIPDLQRRIKKTPGRAKLDVYMEYRDETGWDVFCVPILHRNLILCWDLDILAKVLPDRKMFPKNSAVTEHLRMVAGVRLFGKHGLLTDPGTDLWAAKRRILDPAFHKSFLKTIMFGMNKITTNLLYKLDMEVGKDGFDITNYFNRSALEAVSICGFDWDEDSLEVHGNSILEASNLAMATLTSMFTSPSSMVFNLPFYKKHQKDQLRKIFPVVRQVLREHLRKRLDSEDTSKDDILSYIIKANKCSDVLTLEDLIDEYLLFIFAGMETTAIVMAMTVFYLSVYPDVYKKVQNEVEGILDDRSEPDFEDLNKMVYLEMVIKETLRLKPPARITSREVAKPISLGGIHFPKDAIIVVPTYAIQRDPRYWADPLKFIPERFESKITNYTYMPFAAGSRNCIGKHFAMLEIKVIVSRLVMKYKIVNPTPDVKDLPTHGAVTTRPIDGVVIQLLQRE